MPRAPRPCATPGCPELVEAGTSRCQDCEGAQRATQRRNRDKEAHAHYNSRGHRRFRRLVLTRDPLCVLCLAEGRTAVATEADHWPIDRRELQARGLAVNDPDNGRGLCKSCHSKETAKYQPGGWAAR